MQAALEADPALRARLRADQEALTALVEALPPAEPPAGAEDRLMARLAAEREQGTLADPPRRRVAWWPLAGLGLAAVLALTFVLRPPADPLQRYARLPGATTPRR